MPCIQSLWFEGCHVDSSDGFKDLAACMKTLTALTAPQLHVEARSEESEAASPDAAKEVAASLRGMPCLRQLSIELSDTGSEGSKALSDAVAECFGPASDVTVSLRLLQSTGGAEDRE